MASACTYCSPATCGPFYQVVRMSFQKGHGMLFDCNLWIHYAKTFQILDIRARHSAAVVWTCFYGYGTGR